MANGVIDIFDTSNWVTNSTLEVVIDISLTTQLSDFFDLTGDTIDVLITGINLLDEEDLDEIKIAVADANDGFKLDLFVEQLETENFIYTVSELYEDNTYYLVLNSSPIPEPSTATLTFLSLAGLCARRRRKN